MPVSWEASGAGDADYNGVYDYVSMYNGEAWYINDAGMVLFISPAGRWILADTLGSTSPDYAGAADEPLPALPWIVVDGTPPAPSFAAYDEYSPDEEEAVEESVWGEFTLIGVRASLAVDTSPTIALSQIKLFGNLGDFPQGMWIERIHTFDSNWGGYTDDMDGWRWLEDDGTVTYQAGSDGIGGIHLSVDGDDVDFQYTIDGVVVYSGTAVDARATCEINEVRWWGKYHNKGGALGDPMAMNGWTEIILRDDQSVMYDWLDEAQQQDWNPYTIGRVSVWESGQMSESKNAYGNWTGASELRKSYRPYYAQYTLRPFVARDVDGSLRLAVPVYGYFMGKACSGLSALPHVKVYHRNTDDAAWTLEQTALDATDFAQVACDVIDAPGWSSFPFEAVDGDFFDWAYGPTFHLSGYTRLLDGSDLIALGSDHGAQDSYWAGSLHTIVQGYDGASPVSQVPGQITLWRRTTDSDQWEYVGGTDRAGSAEAVYTFCIDHDNVVHALAQSTEFDDPTYTMDVVYLQAEWPIDMELTDGPRSLIGNVVYTTDETAWWAGQLVPPRPSVSLQAGEVIFNQTYHSETFGRDWKDGARAGGAGRGFPNGAWDPHENKFHLVTRVEGELYYRALSGTVPEITAEAELLTRGEEGGSIELTSDWQGPITTHTYVGNGYEVAMTRAAAGDLWLMVLPLSAAHQPPLGYVDTYRSLTDGQDWQYMDRLVL